MAGERFSFHTTGLADLWLCVRGDFSDARGVFAKLFSAPDFKKIGVEKPLRQINHSLSREKGTVRGLHFQYPPHAETRIVTCTAGKIFDVAVDLRKNSPTYLKHYGVELSPKARNCLVIPEGFAHGFQTLEKNCEITYLHTGDYVPDAEDGLNVADPALGIDWPLPVSGLSERDKAHKMLSTREFSGIDI
ncbi:MAG: dTDP-4-dehydrorhamnose 3,5-epimerase [Micavibrio sp.]|nr:MAG: dTDP-4-dehydrorhamnose 3,5-epimerase [Micavibrio sp.]